MIKKITKIILVILVFLGIAYSISNFLSVEAKAVTGGHKGVLVDVGGYWECTGDGGYCDLMEQ